MKKLYGFYWDCGRNGSVEGIFVADDADVQKAIGQNIYFGEILGKHSEIHGSLDEGDLTIITDDQDFILKYEGYINKTFGYNPLDYIQVE